MNAIEKDVIIVGGGPAGLAAAVELHNQGITDILVIEREKQLGGILRQCIHDGFGLTRFGETLSGPEYSQRFIDSLEALEIPYITDTTVVNITNNKLVTCVSREGLIQYQAKAVILAMGCRERTRGAISIPGSRPSGIYNAGVAQSYINLHNTMVGSKVAILGSGDIGMIMARRLTLEGAHVVAVFEVKPYASGLPRNVEQCLKDYGIPLYLSHTVTNIRGRSRLEGITVAQVDEFMKPIPGTEKDFACDTLILSVGLIPENELSLAAGVELDMRTKGAVVDESYQTNVDGIFAAGNVLHVHDLVDFVSKEAESLAGAVADYISKDNLNECSISILPGSNIGYTIPQKISGTKDVRLSMRVLSPMHNCVIQVVQGNHIIKSVMQRKALPAEMIQFDIKSENILPTEQIEVNVI